MVVPFDGSRSICHACWVRLSRDVHRQRDQQVQDQLPEQPEDQPNQQDHDQGPSNQQGEQEVYNDGQDVRPGFMSLQVYSRASNTARRCIFNGCRNTPSHIVPTYIRFHLLNTNKYYIPQLARVCHPHLVRNDLEELSAQTPLLDFNHVYVLDMFELFKWGLDRSHQLDFENIEEIDDGELHFWTGVTKVQFNLVLSLTPSLRTRTDKPATALGIYLTKIRTGEPDRRLATKFKISKSMLERKIHIARTCLTDDFVPHFLDIDHITQEEFVSRNLTIPAHIFGGNHDARILVFDGTYLHVQKSANFLFQRISYSLHKFRNLVKPFLIVCTDGYIVDVIGPYAATTSDATIMRSIMQENSDWHWFLRSNDVFILDSGFRDYMSTIEGCGYNPHLADPEENNYQRPKPKL
ncbi:hypothetical protein HF086_003127 [Spodoptera exigua]|uniref:DDE Tnp4 domain-containing protein n=1 Tax=Spodoptera exigua TaxID=7107 RepID=A0A922SMV7_SPOEX|nr:hypothetical protein HF086_003127 [Spodoptera exigua]